MSERIDAYGRLNKRRKIINRVPSVYEHSDPQRQHDRILIVNGVKFYVESELLTNDSDFFQALFKSNFKEKKEKKIQLTDVTPKDLSLFLIAVEMPKKFHLTEKNLDKLARISCYFQAERVLMKVLEGHFDRFDNEFLLKLTEDTGFTLIPDKIESEYLAEVEAVTEKELEKRLKIANGYRLGKLKTAIDVLLSKKFNMQKKFEIDYIKYLNYAKKHDLAKLMNTIETSLLAKIESKSVLNTDYRRYLRMSSDYELIQLKGMLEENMIEYYGNNRSKKYIIESYLQNTMNFCLNKLKTTIEVSLREYFKNKRGIKEVRNEYLQYSNKYQLNDLKLDIENILIEQFLLSTNKSYCYYLSYSCKYSLHRLKEMVEDSVTDNIHFYTNNPALLAVYLEKTVEYKLIKLKDTFETEIISSLKKNNSKTATYLDLCEKYEMNKVKDFIDRMFIKHFNMKKDLSNFERAFKYNLTEFKKVLVDFLQKCNLDDYIMKKNKSIILAMPPSIQNIMFRSMLR